MHYCKISPRSSFRRPRTSQKPRALAASPGAALPPSPLSSVLAPMNYAGKATPGSLTTLLPLAVVPLVLSARLGALRPSLISPAATGQVLLALSGFSLAGSGAALWWAGGRP